MGPISVLKTIGLTFKHAFKDRAKIEKVGEEIMVEGQPLIDTLLTASVPWAVPLYNEAVTLIKNSEIASAVATDGAEGTGDSKAAFVIKQFEPIALKLLQGHGVSNPTADQLQRYIDGAVETMDAFDAMVALEHAVTPAPAPTPAK